MKSPRKFHCDFAGRKILAHLCRLLVCALVVSGGLASAAAESNSEFEGTVTYVRPVANGGLELRLDSGTNWISVDVLDAGGNSPVLFSQVLMAGGTPVESGSSRLVISRLDQIQFLTGSVLPLAANVAALRRLGSAGRHAECVAHLEGQVLAVSLGGGTFAFQDDTGVALLEMDPQGRLVAPGQKIILEGNCAVEGDRVVLHNPPTVDNNNLHGLLEKSGEVFLSAGKHPLRLDWFNQESPSGLEVYYQGPDLPRQRIPAAVLFHQETDPVSGVGRVVNGLAYSCYEGNWLRVPDFDRLIPAKQGTSVNFDTDVTTRFNNVGLQYTGYLEVPRSGIYRFSTISDDGSLMFVDEEPPAIKVTGTNALPDPVSIAVRETLGADQNDRWSQAGGTVTFASEQGGTLELELSSDTGRMRVEVADSSGCSPQLLLNSRIRATGICPTIRTAEGQTLAGMLLAPGADQIELQSVPAEKWNEHPIIPVGSLAGIKVSPGAETIVHVRGKLHFDSGGRFFVDDGTGFVRVKTTQPLPHDDGGLVEVLGRWNRERTNIVLQSAFYREIAGQPRNESADLPLLITVEQIKRLNREEWQRGYPVKIRGVVTTALDGGFFIQDSTGSIYARRRAPTGNDVPQVEDLWEIEGSIFAEFAPNIQVSGAARLGTGSLPEPLHPTWDQLINGSLDTEYVEVQGIITEVESGGVTLLMRAGKIKLLLSDMQTQVLHRYENALVRVRGCVIPSRDGHTQQVIPGQLQLSNPSITVDGPAPADLFSLPVKHVSDLLLFDSRAGALQRVKVAGQMMHQRDGELFLMDGSDGLRVIPNSTNGMHVGDMVEAVGFADLGGPSPILREAVVRRVGSVRLPEPVPLLLNPPLNRRYDATLVRVTARLVAINRNPSEQVLELQSGTRGFVARLKTRDGLLPAIRLASQLELTGVYAGHAGDRALDRNSDAFELLLNSPADVTVLEQPSWWTLRRSLAVLGVMAVVLLGAMLWAVVLKRQVVRQTQMIRQNVEHAATLEERARIARELHDTLEQALVGLGLQLNALAATLRDVPANAIRILETARSMVRHGQEEARRTVRNLRLFDLEKNDLPAALSRLAAQSCGDMQVTVQASVIGIPRELPGQVESHMLRICQEAITNAIKHGRARNIQMDLGFENGTVRLSVRDDGCGFETDRAASSEAGHFGLLGMRERAEKLGGVITTVSAPGKGTTIQVVVPVK